MTWRQTRPETVLKCSIGRNPGCPDITRQSIWKAAHFCCLMVGGVLLSFFTFPKPRSAFSALFGHGGPECKWGHIEYGIHDDRLAKPDDHPVGHEKGRSESRYLWLSGRSQCLLPSPAARAGNGTATRLTCLSGTRSISTNW